MRPTCFLLAALAALALPTLPAQAQTTFGTSCAGASGVTPELAVSGVVQAGQPWTLEVTAPGGIGLGYLLVGFSNTSASALGGVPLPLDLGAFFGDPLWGGCELAIDPSYLVLPYTFDPNTGGGVWTKNFPGFDTGQLYVQALNIDPDFVTRIAGVSEGLDVIGPAELVPGMVPIAPGTFQMGSNAPWEAPYHGWWDEKPVHSVTISQPFWMGQHEVTQAEYEALMGSHTSQYVGASRPVEKVSWASAVQYCQALTAQESLLGNLPAGYEYRLPTEAEWEYACRAGTTTEFNVGNELFCADAWFAGTYHPMGNLSSCNNPVGTINVGSYAPNAWGLFDMHGNVWEWCMDVGPQAYPAGHVTDPFVDGVSGAFTNRAIRGGSFLVNSNGCRSAQRSQAWGFNTFDQFGEFGFRVVLAPVLGP